MLATNALTQYPPPNKMAIGILYTLWISSNTA